MRILVTGTTGYIGSVLAPLLQAAGHDVVGLDTGFYEDCTFGEAPPAPPTLRMDVRDVTASDLNGFDAVMHLAALSNDPLGNLDPELTYAINHGGSVRLARAARAGGVGRPFGCVSCSMYWRGQPPGGKTLTRRRHSTRDAVRGIEVARRARPRRAGGRRFSPDVFLRNATAYGVSPYLRADLVSTTMVGWA